MESTEIELVTPSKNDQQLSISKEYKNESNIENIDFEHSDIKLNAEN